MKRLKLRPFNLLSVNESGEIATKKFKRGIPGKLDEGRPIDLHTTATRGCGTGSLEPDINDGGCEWDEDWEGEVDSKEDREYTDLPSLHEIKRKSNVVAWDSVRSSLRSVVVETNALPLNSVCSFCQSFASIRCMSCGSGVFFCIDCLKASHTKRNVFHCPEEWKVRSNYSLISSDCFSLLFFLIGWSVPSCHNSKQSGRSTAVS